LIPYDDFLNAKHITLLVTNDSVAVGSALYSYILTLHKKVTFVQEGSIDFSWRFVPWYKELKKHTPVSSDCIYKVDAKVDLVYRFFQTHHITINKKMATALYSALLKEYNFFNTPHLNGMVFAMASELIAYGAEYEKARLYLQNSQPLSLVRLHTMLVQTMVLQENGTVAVLFFNDALLQASGAVFEDALRVMKEVLRVVHVQRVELRDTDTNNTIIQTIKDI